MRLGWPRIRLCGVSFSHFSFSYDSFNFSYLLHAITSIVKWSGNDVSSGTVLQMWYRPHVWHFWVMKWSMLILQPHWTFLDICFPVISLCLLHIFYRSGGQWCRVGSRVLGFLRLRSLMFWGTGCILRIHILLGFCMRDYRIGILWFSWYCLVAGIYW